LRHCIYTCSQYLFFWTCRGYLVKTEAGKARLEEAGIKGAYLGPDGRVLFPYCYRVICTQLVKA